MARGAVAVRCVAPCATWVSYGAVQYGGEGTARCACAGIQWGPSFGYAMVGDIQCCFLMIRVSPAPRQPEP